MNQEIFYIRQPVEDHQEISLEKLIARRMARRRRVAKRMAKRFPLLAVEFMQDEFPGYTYQDWESDVLRKSRKGKSFRRPKPKSFDWNTIREHIPDFFAACKSRSKTRAVLRGRLKDGTEFICIVRSYWMDDYGQQRLRTHELIKLWRSSIQTFVKHPSVQIFEPNNEI